MTVTFGHDGKSYRADFEVIKGDVVCDGHIQRKNDDGEWTDLPYYRVGFALRLAAERHACTYWKAYEEYHAGII